jgi:hypothetical protein
VQKPSCGHDPGSVQGTNRNQQINAAKKENRHAKDEDVTLLVMAGSRPATLAYRR